MDAPSYLKTARLTITPLAATDDHFIFQLVNTEGWLQNIGNRNVTSAADAVAYIQRILNNNQIAYWVVKLKDMPDKIGIVTYIKRDYLEHPDIGFAFLPPFFNKGYAYEATTAVLHELIGRHNVAHIVAVTVPGNINSIKLLKKIGLVFEKEMEVKNEKLQVYGASTEELITRV